MITNTQKALAALVLGGLSAMSAHAQTVIFSDNFSGSAGSAPNASLWSVTTPPGDTVTLTGSNQVNVNGDAGGNPLLTANTGAYSASGIPTASTTDLSPSNYYIQTTISTYTVNSGLYQIDLVAGSYGNGYLDIAGDSGSTLKFGVGTGATFGDPLYDSMVSTSATNQFVIDQYTNDILVYANGVLAYDEAVNTPADILLPLTSTAGLVLNDYAGGNSTIGPVSVAEVSAESVPEPSTLALLGVGFTVALFLIQKRKRFLSA